MTIQRGEGYYLLRCKFSKVLFRSTLNSMVFGYALRIILVPAVHFYYFSGDLLLMVLFFSNIFAHANRMNICSALGANHL